MCGCELCRQGMDFNTLYDVLDQKYHFLLRRLESDLYQTKVDLDYEKAIIGGTWPNAEKHMRALGWQRIKEEE